MTERSSEGLDERRRKLLFRAWRRGVREMDLIIGRFADVHIASFDDAGLDDFERLIEAPNAALYAWVTGAEAVRRRVRHRRAGRASRRSMRAANETRAGDKPEHGRANQGAIAGGSGWRPAGRCFSPASPTAPKGWCWPISPARSRRARTRPRSASRSSAATARAWRRCRARSPSSRPTSRCWNFRPGIACLTTAPRRMRRLWRSA